MITVKLQVQSESWFLDDLLEVFKKQQKSILKELYNRAGEDDLSTSNYSELLQTVELYAELIEQVSEIVFQSIEEEVQP